jgi:hypothetical protein
MNINTLRESDSWPIWDEVVETTPGRFAIPLPNTPEVHRTGLPLLKDIPEDHIFKIGGFWCSKSPESHIGPFRHAIDFLMADGTPILAACDGTIIEIVEHFNTWGNGPEYADTLNYVTIQHTTSEFSQYCHLMKDSVPKGIHVGSSVNRGDMIGKVGKTGWTDRDHLHFLVFEGHPNKFGFRSLKIQW